MVTLLITRPLYDHTTYYLAHWSKRVIDFAKSKGNKVLDLKDKRANRKTFESVLRKMHPILLLFNGHGDTDVVLGHHNEPLLLTGENEDLLENKIVYALLKGHTAQEACERSKRAILKNIQHLTAINSPDQFMIPELLWNMDNLECLGDQNAHLEKSANL